MKQSYDFTREIFHYLQQNEKPALLVLSQPSLNVLDFPQLILYSSVDDHFLESIYFKNDKNFIKNITKIENELKTWSLQNYTV